MLCWWFNGTTQTTFSELLLTLQSLQEEFCVGHPTPTTIPPTLHKHSLISIRPILFSQCWQIAIQLPCRLKMQLYSIDTVYPKKYAHGFAVLCFVVVMQSFIMNSHKVFIHIHQGSYAGTGAIIWLPQCQWSKPDGYGKMSQCITTTKHSKAKTVCIFLGIYCIWYVIKHVLIFSNIPFSQKILTYNLHNLGMIFDECCCWGISVRHPHLGILNADLP